MLEIAKDLCAELRPRICVMGVGGGGGNAIANMIGHGVSGVDFVVLNTDAQALNASLAPQRIQLGRKATLGLGAGARPAVGGLAAAESMDAIQAALQGAHLCVIAAGMGGGTGTGAAPTIARMARELGILTIAVVTKPFDFEGRRRTATADAGIEQLARHVDTLIVIPNQNLFRIADSRTTIREAFQMADAVLEQGVRTITDLVVNPGIINLDFADLRTVMMTTGRAVLGTGEAAGPGRATAAARMAIANPLLDGDISGAEGLLISIAGDESLSLLELEEAAAHVCGLVGPGAEIIWGSSIDPALEGRVRVSIVATGIRGEDAAMPLVQAAVALPVLADESAPAAAVERDTRPEPAAEPLALAPPPAIEAAPSMAICDAGGPDGDMPGEDILAAGAPPAAGAGLAEIDTELDLCAFATIPIAAEPPIAEPPSGRVVAMPLRSGPVGPSLFQRMVQLTSGGADRIDDDQPARRAVAGRGR